MSELIYSVVAKYHAGQLSQFSQSVRSLRKRDTQTAMHLIFLGNVPDEVKREADRGSVTIHQVKTYREFLMDQTPHFDAFDSDYPYLAKWYFTDVLPEVDRYLYVDTDTFWFQPPKRLFDKYDNSADFYAVPEYLSDRYPYAQPQPGFTAQCLKMCREQGVAPLEPQNNGVCLFSGAVLDHLRSSTRSMIDYTARIRGYEPGRKIDNPNDNPHTIEMFGHMLALAAMPGLRVGMFDLLDVPLANYYEAPNPIVWHYTSFEQPVFFERFPRIK